MTQGTPSSLQTTDVAIIGAGPVGVFGVFACGMLGLKTHVFDALPAIGGQCTALYPQKPIYDIPGFPSVLAGDLVDHLVMQAAPFAPVYHLGSSVVAVDHPGPNQFIVTSENGTSVSARAILIACGAGAFGPNRPPIDGIDSFENQSVFYTVQKPHEFKSKHVVIAGGGDSAIDWAVHLADIASTVTIVHRRDTFRAAPASLEKLNGLVQAGRIQKCVPYQLESLSGANGQIDTVWVRDLDNNKKALTADALLCFFGLSTNLGILGALGLAVEDNAIVTNPTTGATSLPGLYAAGDGVIYPNKQKLILTGFSEISQAAQAIYRALNPGVDLHHVHSTTKGVPGK
jgi:thioredoxin reductase (NADPH)